MKVLITGITGFIGQRLGVSLVQSGHRIVGLSRNAEDCQSKSPFPLDCYKWNGESDVVPLQALDGVDAVIHLAGESVSDQRWTDERKIKLIDSRVKSAKNLLDSLSAAKVSPRVFVSASAVGFYGDRGDEKLTEGSSQGEGFLAELTSKWEAETRRAQELFADCRVVQLRQGLVLGWGQGFLGQVVPIFRLGFGGKLGDGKQWISFIQIDDLIHLIKYCLEQEECSGVINAVMPEPMRNKEMTACLAEELDVRTPFSVPSLALKVALGEMSQMLLSSQRVLPQRLSEIGFKFEFTSFQQAIKEELKILARGLELYMMDQWVPEKVDKVSKFFHDEENLEKTLPHGMGLKIVGKKVGEIRGGKQITFNIKAGGLPPLRHRQEFLTLGEGTLIRDHIEYKIPLGKIGILMNRRSVKNSLDLIFNFRRQRIAGIFGLK